MSQFADGNSLAGGLQHATSAAGCTCHDICHANADYICQGPLLQAARITLDDVHHNLQEWRDLAQELISNLSLPSIDALDAGQRCALLLGCQPD